MWITFKDNAELSKAYQEVCQRIMSSWQLLSRAWFMSDISTKKLFLAQFGMIWICLTNFYHIGLFRSMSDTLCFLSQFERKNMSNSLSVFLNLCKSRLNSLASLSMFSSRSLNPSYWSEARLLLTSILMLA